MWQKNKRLFFRFILSNIIITRWLPVPRTCGFVFLLLLYSTKLPGKTDNWYPVPIPFKNVYAEFQADRMKNVKRLGFEALINRPLDKIFENAETGTQKFSTHFISIYEYFSGEYSSRLGFWFFQKYKFFKFSRSLAQKGRFEPNKKRVL